MVLLSEAVRREIVEQVRASFALEGMNPSPEQEAAMEQWIRGEKTIDELIEDAKARWAKARR